MATGGVEDVDTSKLNEENIKNFKKEDGPPKEGKKWVRKQRVVQLFLDVIRICFRATIFILNDEVINQNAAGRMSCLDGKVESRLKSSSASKMCSNASRNHRS